MGFYCSPVARSGDDQLKTDNAPLMKRLVFPFEFTHDKKDILSDREKIFNFAETLLPKGEASNGDGGRGLFMGSSNCLLYTSPSPRDATLSRMPSSA